MKITFITGNQLKFDAAVLALKGSQVELVRKELEVPEIQSTSVEDIASFSAQWASQKLSESVVVTDAGYFITALNGFPGPFIKYINQWLTPQDLLKLMEGKKDREVIVRDCLAYCKPGQKPVTFIGEAKGTLSEKVVKLGRTPISTIFIPEGFDKTEPELTDEEMFKFWNSNLQVWPKLAEYLTKNN